MRHYLLLLTFTTVTFGQTFAVKDRHHITLVIISDVKLFQHSSKLNQDIPHFKGILQNVSSIPLNAAIVGTIYKKNGSVDTFPIGVRFDPPPGAQDVDEFGLPDFYVMPCTVLYPCVFKPDSPYKIAYSFPQPWFSEEDFQSVAFSFPDDWQSPEDKRLAKEVQAEKDGADAARRKRLAAEQKRKQAELDARIVKERADEEAKAAEERRKIRLACATIYQNTADKKLKDLTVKEEQQVRACQALGLYPP
jgi:hypothetical protein